MRSAEPSRQLAKTRTLLDVLGFTPRIAAKGQPAPIQAGYRWPVEDFMRE